MSRPDLPPLTWLRAYEAAARHLSFTLAAKELNLTQSAISQHVRSLETWLGHDLFLRRTRALSLTEAGANYLPVVREAFQLLAGGTRALVGGDRGHRLRLNCNMSFAAYWLAPRMGRLRDALPWLQLHVMTATWGPQMEPGNTDFEIWFLRPEEMSADAELLFTESLSPVCAPGFAGDAPDWLRDPLMDCAGVLSGWHSWAEAAGRPLAPGQRVELMSTYVISLSAALNGQGLAMGQGFMPRALQATSALIEPWPDQRLPLSEVYFMIPPPRHAETPASRAFADWLRAEVAADTQTA